MSAPVYKWAVHEWMLDGVQKLDPVECDSCGYHAPVHTYTGHTEASMRANGIRGSEKRHLCQLCAESMCSNHTGYPSQHPNHEQSVLTVYCANAVLDELGKFRGAPVVTSAAPRDEMEIG